jgi:hypothetical protein
MSLFEFEVEELIKEHEAKPLLVPIAKLLRRVWTRSWKRYLAINEQDRARIEETPTARPGLLSAFAQHFAKHYFAEGAVDGVVPCLQIPGVYILEVQKRILLRFNGLTQDRVVRIDHGTPLKKEYFQQEPIRGLNNSASRLTVGYVLDEAGIALRSIEISLQKGDALVFSFPIEPRGTIPMPIPAAEPPQAPSELLKKAKPR